MWGLSYPTPSPRRSPPSPKPLPFYPNFPIVTSYHSSCTPNLLRLIMQLLPVINSIISGYIHPHTPPTNARPRPHSQCMAETHSQHKAETHGQCKAGMHSQHKAKTHSQCKAKHTTHARPEHPTNARPEQPPLSKHRHYWANAQALSGCTAATLG